MHPEIKQFMETQYESKAIIKDSRTVIVTIPNGEEYIVYAPIGTYIDEWQRNYEVHLLEWIFDKCYYESNDTKNLIKRIWREALLNGISIKGISQPIAPNERIRVGKRIRQLREERGIEARDLAQLAGIDTANLSRIENGKLSVGLDILSKIALTLGKQIDFVNITNE